MEPGQPSSAETAYDKSAVEKKIADMESIIGEARRLVQGTDAMFERNGLSRDKLSEIAMKTGVAALGAQMRKEEAAAEAPKKPKKKKPKRARVRI